MPDRDQREHGSQEMRDRPGEHGPGHAQVEPDHEHGEPDDGQHRRQRLDDVPEPDSPEAEEHAADALPDDVGDQGQRGDEHDVDVRVADGHSPARDRQGPDHAEHDGDREGRLDELLQVGAALLHLVRDGVSELPQEPGEDGHAQDDEHERPPAGGVQVAALDDDEHERERRREAVPEEGLEETLVDLPQFRCPDEVGRDGRRPVEGRRPDVGVVGGQMPVLRHRRQAKPQTGREGAQAVMGCAPSSR
jgi:hypothetical protein